MPTYQWVPATADDFSGFASAPSTAFQIATSPNPSLTINGPVRGVRFRSPQPAAVGGGDVEWLLQTNETGPITLTDFTRPNGPTGGRQGPYQARINGIQVITGGAQGSVVRPGTPNSRFRVIGGGIQEQNVQFEFGRSVTGVVFEGFNFDTVAEGVRELEVLVPVPDNNDESPCRCCGTPVGANPVRCWLPVSVDPDQPPSRFGSFGAFGRRIIAPGHVEWRNFGGIPGLTATMMVQSDNNNNGAFGAGGVSWGGAGQQQFNLFFNRPVFVWGLYGDDYDSTTSGEQAFAFEPEMNWPGGNNVHFTIVRAANAGPGGSDRITGLNATGQGWITFDNDRVTSMHWTNTQNPAFGGTYHGILFSTDRRALCQYCEGDLFYFDTETQELVDETR